MSCHKNTWAGLSRNPHGKELRLPANSCMSEPFQRDLELEPFRLSHFQIPDP